MKHNFALFIKNNCKTNQNNCFTITDNQIFDNDYQSLYKFDHVFNTQYSANDLLKNEDIENKHNITFTIFGLKNSGKSTFLRGKKAISNTNVPKSKSKSTNIKKEEANQPGIMISIVNDYYTKVLNMIDNKDDIIVLKFSAFGKQLSNSHQENGGITIENLIKTKINTQSAQVKKNNLLDAIYPFTLTSGKQSSYIVKKINSFKDLIEELREVIQLKESIYSLDQSYYIHYYYLIEIKSKELTTKYHLHLNFYEINCEDCSVLQPLMIELNTRVITESDDPCQSIIDTITNRHNDNQTVINVLCLENNCFNGSITLNNLKLMRFLELTFDRNDLYENTAEICENCCLLKDQLKEVYVSQEEILKQIQTMNEQADVIASIVNGISTYNKNTMPHQALQDK